MLKQRLRFDFIHLAQITQCPEIVWVRKKMPPPWTGCRHPDLSSMVATNGINEIVWDKLCFKAAVHGGQIAVKMFTGFDTTSCQGRGGHPGTPQGAPRRCPEHWASLGRDYLALSHYSEVCAGSQPESTLSLAGCQKTKEQILPLSGSPLPSPYTCNWNRDCAWDKLEPPWQQLGWEQGKGDPTKKDQVKEDWSTAGSHPACGVGHQH